MAGDLKNIWTISQVRRQGPVKFTVRFVFTEAKDNPVAVKPVAVPGPYKE